MMTCPEIREALDALLDGELGLPEEAQVREHLEWCLACGRELEELKDWNGSLAEALAGDAGRPSAAERRRTADAVIAAVRGRSPTAARWAALLAVGLSVGVVAGALTRVRPPREQIDRVVEQLRRRRTVDARLRIINDEIEQDLGEARRAVAHRAPEDAVARVLAVGSLNIARQLGGTNGDQLRKSPEVSRVLAGLEASDGPAECISITRILNGVKVSLTQLRDGRIRLVVPGTRLEVRSMQELVSAHPDLCRRYSISGADGALCVGDSSAGADWKARMGLLLRTGAWDQAAELDAYRGWIAGKGPGPLEFERRLKAHAARARVGKPGAAPVPVDVDAILREVRVLTREQLQNAQARAEGELKSLEARLEQARMLRERARELRVFAEEASRD